jgi:hypothetical protein
MVGTASTLAARVHLVAARVRLALAVAICSL